MVSKANHPQQPQFHRQNFIRQPYSPRFPTLNTPPLLLDRNRDQQKFRDAFDPFVSPTNIRSRSHIFSQSTNTIQHVLASSSVNIGVKTDVGTSGALQGRAGSQQGNDAGIENMEQFANSASRWSESDFPPLSIDEGNQDGGAQKELTSKANEVPINEADVGEINE